MEVFDGKGSPDWRKFSLVADSYGFGLTPTKDGLPPEILLETLVKLKEDVQDRYHRLSELDPAVCPEGKLTREIARDPRFAMPVRMLVIDEWQEYYDLGKISDPIADLIAFLVKVAPGVKRDRRSVDLSGRRGSAGRGICSSGSRRRGITSSSGIRCVPRISGSVRWCWVPGRTARASIARSCCRSTRVSGFCVALLTRARPCARIWRTGRTRRRS